MDFLYAINIYTPEPIFQINTHIGNDEDIKDAEGNIIEVGDGMGIDGRVFSKEYLTADSLNPKNITTYINTQGGDYNDGLEIFNAIVNAKSKTKNVINGFCYSTGGWIALAADEVEMFEHSPSWMCHMPYTASGNKNEALNRVIESIAKIISGKSGRNGKPKLSIEEVKFLMENETYYTAQQMFEKGLIDRVLNSSTEVIQNYQKQQKFFNKHIQKLKVMQPSEQILNKAKAVLNRDADSEADVLSAFAKLEEKVSNYKAKFDAKNSEMDAINESQEENLRRLKDMESKVENSSKEHEKLKGEYEKMKNDMEDISNKAKKSEEELEKIENKNKEEKAINYIEELKTLNLLGTTDETVINFLKEDLINDFARTKARIEIMPRSISVPKPVDVNPNAPSVGDDADAYFKAKNKAAREAKIKA